MPALRPHSTATTDVAWDAARARRNLRNDGAESYYRRAFAWQDPDADVEKEFQMPEPEHKVFACAFTFAKELTEAGQFEGHAAVFNNVDLQGDKIKRGAFLQTIEESGGRWPVLFGHNTGRVVGFSTSAEEDAKGLRVEGEFTLASDEGRNAYATAKHAAGLNQKFGLSIGYAIRGDDGASYDSAAGIRTLKNLTVYEFSLAAIPANPRARIASVKAAGDWTIREFEEHLRDAGLSKEAAKRFAAGGFSALDRRDAGGGDGSDEERAAREFLSGLRKYDFLFEAKERIY